MINTLYQKKAGNFIPKKAVLSLSAQVEGRGSTRVGRLTLDICEFREHAVVCREFAVQSSADRTAKIVLSIKAIPAGTGGSTDNMSDVSGGSGISMGSEESYIGPSLSTEQVEEEKRVIPGTLGRPPAVVSCLRLDFSPKKQDSPNRQQTDRPNPDVLKQRIHELEDSLADSEAKHETFKANCTDQLEILEREIQESEEDRSRLIGECNTLKREAAKLRDLNAGLKQELEETKAKLTASESRSAQGREDERVRKELMSVAALANKLQEEKESSDQECCKLQAQLSTARVNYELAQHSIRRLREELASGRKVTDEDEPMAVYRRQTDTIINHLKAQLKEAEQFRIAALNRQEEMALEIHERASVHKRNKDAVGVNADLEQIRAQLELTQEAKERAEKRLGEVSAEWRDKLQAAHIRLKELEEEQVSATFEVKKLQRASRVSLIQEGLSSSQELADKLRSAETRISQLSIENAALLKSSQDLQKQLKVAQERLENAEYAASVEKAQHLERISQLETEVDMQARANARLKREIKEQDSSPTADTSLIQSLQLCKLELDDLRDESKQLRDGAAKAEARILELKMQIANIELERDTVVQKHRDTQERLRLFSTQYTTIEVELYKANDRYCQAINTNNELEFELQGLRKQLEAATLKKRR
jgi:chromosome segregation ATPase